MSKIGKTASKYGSDNDVETVTTTRLDPVMEVSLCIRRFGTYLTFTLQDGSAVSVELTEKQQESMRVIINCAANEINGWYKQQHSEAIMPTLDSKTLKAINKAQALADSKASKPRARTLQQIFDAVIDAGYYRESGCNDYMCNSLSTACEANIITQGEYNKALKAVNQYSKPTNQAIYTLRNVLYKNGLPYVYSDRLAIYRNWARRPKINKNAEQFCN